MKFILLVHNYKKVIELVDETGNKLLLPEHASIAGLLYRLASQYPDSLFLWAHLHTSNAINTRQLREVFPHKLVMASFSFSKSTFFGHSIGYVEQTPFINISFDVPYPTWQMSSDLGGIHAQVLLQIEKRVKPCKDFNFFINAIAKAGMAKGLFCYSNPKLAQAGYKATKPLKSSAFQLFRFVKQHYKTQWLFMLWFCLLFFEKRIAVLPLLFSFFSSKIKLPDPVFQAVTPEEEITELKSVDVIIPTLGRKPYLLDFLDDLSNQTVLPQSVVIIEQNPLKESSSELGDLLNRDWPFKIDHTFTHQTGACNARNMALKKVTADYVFFADDDIRVKNDFLQKALAKIQSFGVKAATFNCLMPGEEKEYHTTAQTTNFGSGCSIVARQALNGLAFNTLYEHGYGEDVDFGMQLRYWGTDVVYFPYPEILHLKAPTGGFRYQHHHPWENGAVQPKPSPTVMHFKKKYFTQQQLCGFRVLLYVQFYKNSSVKSPFKYIPYMNKRWKKSLEISNSFK